MSLETGDLEFDKFRLDVAEGILLRDEKPVRLAPKALRLLFVLVENHGRIVSKEDLMQSVWADSFVEDSNLTFTISVLRKALGDRKYIETVPKRGYRFSGKVAKTIREAPGSEIEISAVTPERGDLSTSGRSLTSSRFFIQIAAVSILLAGSLGFGLWYAQSKMFDSPTVLTAPFSSEKLSTSGNVSSAAISPDGKTVVYSNLIGNKGSLWLRQLDSGSNTELIPPSDHVYHQPVFSPDGMFVYFVRLTQSDDTTAIYRMSIFGGIPTRIAADAEGWISLSPAGDRISFIRCYRREEDYCSLWIANASDGNGEQKLVSTAAPIRIGAHQISPDGRSIVFATGQSKNAANEFGLMEIDLETAIQKEWTPQKFFNIRHLSWLPDKSGLLISASRSPNKNFRIWRISPTDGDALPLTNDSETYSSLSIDKEAKMLVSTLIREDFHLSLYEYDSPSAGQGLVKAASLTFAPGGKIVFSSGMSGNDEIWSINADGREQQQLTNAIGEDANPVVSANDGSIFFSSNRTGEMQVWRMNADGSNQTQITHENGGMPLFVSPDSAWVYYHHGRDRTLWRVSSDGATEEMITDKARHRIAFSPDGKQFAYPEEQGKERFIVIVSVTDGQIVNSVKYPDSEARLSHLAWQRDEKNLSFILTDNNHRNSTLWTHDLRSNGTSKKIAALGDDEIANFAVSRDGESFAVTQGGWRPDAILFRCLR